MRIELPLADPIRSVLRATKPVCEVCIFFGGFKVYEGRCETHVKCGGCKCPSGTVSLLYACPKGYFKGGRVIPMVEKVMEARGHARRQQ